MTKLSSVALRQLGNKHPDQNHLHTVFHSLADQADELREMDKRLSDRAAGHGELRDELAKLRELLAAESETITNLTEEMTKLRERVERLEELVVVDVQPEDLR